MSKIWDTLAKIATSLAAAWAFLKNAVSVILPFFKDKSEIEVEDMPTKVKQGEHGIEHIGKFLSLVRSILRVAIRATKDGIEVEDVGSVLQIIDGIKRVIKQLDADLKKELDDLQEEEMKQIAVWVVDLIYDIKEELDDK